MFSSNVEQLKTLNTSETEVTQLVKLKQAGIGDDACVTMVNDAHEHQHLFTSADRHRRMKGLPTLNSAEIGRLKNTGLTEKQIMERINQGMTDAQADREAALREATRNHANTGFVRTRGRHH